MKKYAYCNLLKSKQTKFGFTKKIDSIEHIFKWCVVCIGCGNKTHLRHKCKVKVTTN